MFLTYPFERTTVCCNFKNAFSKSQTKLKVVPLHYHGLLIHTEVLLLGYQDPARELKMPSSPFNRFYCYSSLSPDLIIYTRVYLEYINRRLKGTVQESISILFPIRAYPRREENFSPKKKFASLFLSLSLRVSVPRSTFSQHTSSMARIYMRELPSRLIERDTTINRVRIDERVLRTRRADPTADEGAPANVRTYVRDNKR